MTWSDLIAHIRHLNAAEQDTIRKAFDMGKAAHEGQTRKSGEPYFNHPIAVAGILGDMGADAETITAALLHDTIEDTTITDADIKKAFGPTVLAMVDGVTKLNKEHIANQPTLDAKIETLRKMFTVMQKDVRIMVIKLADRLHNMQTAEFLPEEKQKKLARETLDIYVKIAEQLSMQSLKNALEENIFSILQPETMKVLQAIKKKHNKITESSINTINVELEKNFKDLLQSISIRGEVKSWSEIEAYQSTDENTPNHLTTTVIFICQSIDDCYRTMGALHQLWRRETLSFHDLINAPLLNGYKGLHTTIILPNGERIHCKIRTKEMDVYAEKGITTLCFDGKTLGVQEYLPWTRLINPLTEDTLKRSDEFWESLKSDILGETITVHGPDDGTAMIPSNATALDAIFYLFGNLAIRVKKIRVNGKYVPFDHPLEYADTISIDVDTEKQLTHEWLQFVHTGFALSQIRHILRKEPYTKKIQFARTLLQEYMLQQHGGYLTEYDEKIMNIRVKNLGFESFEKALIGVADGELDIIYLYDSLFNPNITNKPSWYKISMNLPKDSTHSLGLLQYIYQICKPSSIKIRHKKNEQVNIATMNVKIGSEQQLNIFRNLQIQGGKNILIESRFDKRMRFLLCFLLIILWGMDPVFAKKILDSGVNAYSFTSIRLISVFIVALVILGFASIKQPLSHLPLRNKSLWIAGLSFFGIALSTYVTLQYASPTLYNTILRGNVLLIALKEIFKRRNNNTIMIWSGITMFIGYVTILLSQEFSKGLIFSFGVLAIFNIYTLASTRFQKDAQILARYPQYFFYISSISLLCVTSILPFANIYTLSFKHILEIAIYSVIFIGFPYFIFYWLTKRYGYARVSLWISPLLIVTFIGQALNDGSMSVLNLIPSGTLLLIGGMICSANLAKKAEHTLPIPD